MRVAVVINELGIGGTAKAACRWARGLKDRGHELVCIALAGGPRRTDFERAGIEVRLVPCTGDGLAGVLRNVRPDVIHTHAPGTPHQGDVLGDALSLSPRIPVVQTNVLGMLSNPREDAWTHFRLFVSWTSCVQAARRSFRTLDAAFFRRASVVVNPLDPDDGPATDDIAAFRQRLGIAPDELLFGRITRQDPAKWMDLTTQALRLASKTHPRLKLLLREPPATVCETLCQSPDHSQFVILPVTSDWHEMRLTIGSLDVALHTSRAGESFGYSIAEAMNFGKPTIANSVPWAGQGTVELVRHGECGFLASTPAAMATAMKNLADSDELRRTMGDNAQRHVRALANPRVSLDRLEATMAATIAGRDSPFVATDVIAARVAADYLDAHQFGHRWDEQLALRWKYSRVRLRQRMGHWKRRFFG